MSHSRLSLQTIGLRASDAIAKRTSSLSASHVSPWHGGQTCFARCSSSCELLTVTVSRVAHTWLEATVGDYVAGCFRRGDELKEAPAQQTLLCNGASFRNPKSIPGKGRVCFGSLVQS